MKLLSTIAVLLCAFAAGACSDGTAPTDGNLPAPKQAAHDTVAMRTPPAAGGSIDGAWADTTRARHLYLSQAGYVGIYGKLFWTDLRIDGSRVWFLADEPNGGYRHRYNGTLSGNTITGWMGTWYWSLSKGEGDLIMYQPVAFTKRL